LFTSVPSPEFSGPTAEADPKIIPVPAAATRPSDAEPRLLRRAHMVTAIRGGRTAKKASDAKRMMPVVMAPMRMRANMNLDTVPVRFTIESMLEPRTATRGTEMLVAPIMKELGIEFEMLRRPIRSNLSKPSH
jgi:hypothetical protein